MEKSILHSPNDVANRIAHQTLMARGLDYAAKARLASVLAELSAEGRAIVCATHDVEFVAAAADRVVVMAEGEVIADGRTAEVVVASPAFAPQVAKILAPQPWLTVEQVARALA